MTASISPIVLEQLTSFVPDQFSGTGTPSYLGAGWDFAVYRWGDRVLRLPIRDQALTCLQNEYSWIPDATNTLVECGFAVPLPRFRGEPTEGFPRPWLVSDHVPGEPLFRMPRGQRGRAARDIAVALAAMHQPAPPDAPHNPFRNVTLEEKTTAFASYSGRVNLPAELHEVFQLGVQAEPWRGEKLWCHGDLHPGNILSRDQQVTGLIDFGDLGAGDPAVDLAIFFLAFTPEEREHARVILRSLGHNDDDALWARARAWAVHMTAALLTSTDADNREIASQALTLLSANR